MQPEEAAESRHGPLPLPDDTWDTAPTRPRTHVRRHRMPRRYQLVVLVLAVTALVPAVVVPLILSGGPAGDPSTDGNTAAGGSSSATTPVGAPPTPSATTSATGSPVPVETPAAEPPAFTTLVYEAEAARLRQAEVVALDGGSGVRFTGESGEIGLDSVEVPSEDRYRVTVVYAAEGGWSIQVRGAAGPPQRVSLAPTSGCCASVSLEVRLSPDGGLTLEPFRGDGPLPTIDRIIIEAR